MNWKNFDEGDPSTWADQEESAKFVQMPRGLTAENGAKAALMGEFHINREVTDDEGNEATERIDVPWVTIKEIYSAVVKHFQASTKKQAVAPHERISGVCRWKKKNQCYFSVCGLAWGEGVGVLPFLAIDIEPKYCPHCGKKMQVEE